MFLTIHRPGLQLLLPQRAWQQRHRRRGHTSGGSKRFETSTRLCNNFPNIKSCCGILPVLLS